MITAITTRYVRYKLRTQVPRFPIAVLLSFFFISCGNTIITDASRETILVTLPDAHPVYTLLSPSESLSSNSKPSYTAHWYDADGQKQTLANVSDDFFISLEMGVCTPILLMPETARFGIPDGALPAAGAIYPVEGSVSSMKTGMTPIIKTSWLRGISASLAEAICVSSKGGFSSGRNIAGHYNWERFESELSGMTDPSRINRTRFVHALLSGHFTKYDVSCLKPVLVYPVNVQNLPAQCTIFPAWPGSSGFSLNGDNNVPLEACEGINRYFCQSGYLTVQITLGKMTCAFFTPYILQD